MSSPRATLPIAVSLALLCGRGKGAVTEAAKAQHEGRVINNEMMAAAYPSTFHPGAPPYLERDFEVGAEFICDEVKLKRGKDVCAEADINWRVPN